MASTLSNLAENKALLRGLQIASIGALGTITGIATCLHVWVIPVISAAPDSRTKLRQFHITIKKGMRYLLPGGRIIGATLASLALLFSQRSNKEQAQRWKLYALAAAIAASASPWEIFMIFPTNDRLTEMDGEIEAAGKDDFGDARDKVVDDLLAKWNSRHLYRILAPGLAGLISTWSVFAEQQL